MNPLKNQKSLNLVIYFIVFFATISKCSGTTDCFVCAENVPDCPSCDEGEMCYIVKRTCYQCSRAVCAKKSYQSKRKSCNSEKRPKCHCSSDKTCLITVRNRVSCSKAICIERIDHHTKYLKDHKL